MSSLKTKKFNTRSLLALTMVFTMFLLSFSSVKGYAEEYDPGYDAEFEKYFETQYANNPSVTESTTTEIKEIDDEYSAEIITTTYEPTIMPMLSTGAKFGVSTKVTFKWGYTTIGYADIKMEAQKTSSTTAKILTVSSTYQASKGIVKSKYLTYPAQQGNPARALVKGTMTYLYSSAWPGYYYLMNTEVDIKAYPDGRTSVTPYVTNNGPI